MDFFINMTKKYDKLDTNTDKYVDIRNRKLKKTESVLVPERCRKRIGQWNSRKTKTTDSDLDSRRIMDKWTRLTFAIL